jgi:hypothetical protein
MFKLLFFSVWFAIHPVHVTMTSIEFIPENDSFKVFVRMYFDDFLLDSNLNGLAIKKEGFSDGDTTSLKMMEKYISDKVVINVNNKHLAVKLLDMNLVDNEVSMNLDCSFGKRPETITVKNLIMTGLYPDQTNMVIVRINDFEEGVKMTSEITEQTFQIK